MNTECSQLAFEFQSLGGRQVVADFAGGTLTSDAGGLLLREVEARTGLLAKLAGCFDDYRDEDLIEHSVTDLLKQRVFAWRWATKTSTITINCGPIRSWRRSSANAT